MLSRNWDKRKELRGGIVYIMNANSFIDELLTKYMQRDNSIIKYLLWKRLFVSEFLLALTGK